MSTLPSTVSVTSLASSPVSSYTPIQMLQHLRHDHDISQESYQKAIPRLGTGAQDLQLHPVIRLAQCSLVDLDGRAWDAERLTSWWAAKAQMPYRKVDPLYVDVQKSVATMSEAFAARHDLLPLDDTPEEMVVGVSRPYTGVPSWMSALTKQHKKKITSVLINPIELARLRKDFYHVAQSIFKAEKPQDLTKSTRPTHNFEQLIDLTNRADQKSLDSNDHGVIQVVDWLWQYAFEQRASDIHLEPRRTEGWIRFRIDGKLHPIYRMPLTVLQAITSRVKSLGRMDIVERRRPQDGRIKTKGVYGEIEMRLATMPTAFGEKLVMRIFDPEATKRSLSNLGLPALDETRWSVLMKKTSGLVLVTGPTGSGKTTTLYTTLRMLATDDVNVCTVEDPIEMVEPSFNQSQVQPGIEFGFSDSLRALMRQDPDIIMVGEIRDRDTADMAIQSALTGHLVFSTLHTNDAPSAITRLRDLGIPNYLIQASLSGVMAQRLVRTLCTHCKQPMPEEDRHTLHTLLQQYVQTLGDKDPIKQKLLDLTQRATLYHPQGCSHCRQTGYHGRTGVYELLTVTTTFRKAIAQQAGLEELSQLALHEGMTPLRLAALAEVLQGNTSLSEALDCTSDWQ